MEDAADKGLQLTETQTILCPPIPDNLSADSDGTLWIAGHPHVPSLEYMAEWNGFCNSPMLEYEPVEALKFLADSQRDAQSKIDQAGSIEEARLAEFTLEVLQSTERRDVEDIKSVEETNERRQEICESFKDLSWVSRWTIEDGLETVYVSRGYGTSSTAVRDARRGVGLVTGLYQRGIFAWREREDVESYRGRPCMIMSSCTC